MNLLRKKAKRWQRNIIMLIVLIACAITLLLPLYWAIAIDPWYLLLFSVSWVPAGMIMGIYYSLMQ